VAASLRGLDSNVHVCTISEEVGVVPRELEHEVPYYDTYPDQSGIKRASKELAKYVSRHSRHYSGVAAYATSRTFRAIVKQAALASGTNIVLLPREGRFEASSAFFEFMKKRTALRRHVSMVTRRTGYPPSKASI
jgi:predicted RNA-binding protein